MKTKLVAAAATLFVLIASNAAYAGTSLVPDYTWPGIGTLLKHWLFGH